jgi:hypothetical protein
VLADELGGGVLADQFGGSRLRPDSPVG